MCFQPFSSVLERILEYLSRLVAPSRDEVHSPEKIPPSVHANPDCVIGVAATTLAPCPDRVNCLVAIRSYLLGSTRQYFM